MPSQPTDPPLESIKDKYAGPPMPLHYTSPVQLYPRPGLPLNIVALILSYIHDPADLARLTCTSRLLYYMTLPRLYDAVVLRSYGELRYKDNGRPEGYGSGSPFSMGLNALVTKNVAQYVRSLRLAGTWRESDLDDFSKGRVPDNSMMLNIAVRAAMDRMERLQDFAWELNTKPLQTVYQGLLSCRTLQSLTLKFPSTRIPRPTVVVPPLPNLREFKALEIDPLCYPDDISLLLANSSKLDSVHLHFSPRMRDAGEESTNLNTYFARCLATKQPLKLRRYSMINVYTRATNIDLDALIDVESLEEVSFINCNTQDAMTVFIDDTWRLFEPQKIPKKLRVMRGDVLDAKQAIVMSQLKGLECLYLVSTRRKSSRQTPNGVSPGAPDVTTGSSPFAGSGGTKTPEMPMSRESASIAGDYLAAITRHLGATLKHLLLSDQWALSGDVLGRLSRSCPLLEQLGVAVEERSAERMRLHLAAHLPRLWALRVLIRAWPPPADIDLVGSMHEQLVAFELRRREWDGLKWLGVGDMVFSVGGVREVAPHDGHGTGVRTPKSPVDPTVGEELGWRRMVKQVGKDAVRDVEIWKMDSVDVV